MPSGAVVRKKGKEYLWSDLGEGSGAIGSGSA